MLLNLPVITHWLLDAATFIALALLAACVIYGLLLLLAAERLDRRISTRRALRPLEIPRPTERFFYRHHRLVGALLLAGVVAFFLLYAFEFPRDSLLARLARPLGGALAEVVVVATERFLLAANVLIGAFAVVMIVRPSLLKPLEARANRWLSSRQALRGAEAQRTPLDRLVARRPRLAGALVLMGAAYVVINLVVLLR